MKLSARDAVAWCRNPDDRFRAVLIYGDDGAEVAARRRRAAGKILGDGEDSDLRTTRIAGADLRRTPSLLIDAMKARGFFAGPQVVLVDDATDGCSAAITAALEEIDPEDALVIVTAGALMSRSSLRKLFEASRLAAAAPVYSDAADRTLLQDLAKEAGAELSDEGARDLEALASDINSAALRDLLARLALYVSSGDGVIRSEDVEACAPRDTEAAVDDVVDAAASGAADKIGPMVSRMRDQGVSPVSVVIALSRRFRQMHGALSSGSIDEALSRMRPPVFGPRKATIARHCREWGLPRVEGALSLILETNLALRGGSQAAAFPVLERALLRLALSRRR